MKNIICYFILFLFGIQVAIGQNEIFFKTKSSKPTASELAAPQRFEVVISFDTASSRYSLNAIDILDSVFNIAFSKENPRFYKVTMTGYDDGKELNEKNNTLAKDRTEAIYNYFTSRCKADFMIRTAFNTYMNSCMGEQKEIVRYRVPADFKWVSLYGKPDKETKYNQKISLFGKVVIVFEDDVKACLGDFNNCFIPRKDTVIRSSYSTVVVGKGAFQKITGTKDDCNTSLEFTIEEHLDYKSIVENYFLVPHPKQIIVQAGYVVLRTNRPIKNGECAMPLPDSIFVRFATREEQIEDQIRVIGKVYTEKGLDYKALKTRKIKSKVTEGIEAAINATQVDTIFVGKRIQEDELKKFFYPAKSNEPGAFEVKGDYYKAYKINKYGDYILKKPLDRLFRNTQENENPQDLDEFDE